jgi:ferritin-like metal-binding protein YciE
VAPAFHRGPSCPPAEIAYGNVQGAVRRNAQGYLLRRESHPEGPSQDGKEASSKKLETAFTRHEKETQKQVERLEQVFQILGKRASGKKCPAIDGIIEEGEEVMKEAKDDTIRDAAMLAAAQSVEHYEISRYGTLVAWAEKMDMPDAAELLQATLDEEKLTDEKLTALAESEINVEAEDAGKEEEEAPKRRAGGRR